MRSTKFLQKVEGRNSKNPATQKEAKQKMTVSNKQLNKKDSGK